MNKLTKAPSLRCGNDAQHAEELAQYIREAKEGVRKILIVGAKLEWLVSQLERGQIGDWIAAYCHSADISKTTVYDWRKLFRDTLLACGSKLDPHQNSTMMEFCPSWEKFLLLPPGEMPAAARLVREKVDELISGKSSAHQLELSLRGTSEHDHFRCAQAEIDEFLKLCHPKLPRQSYEDLSPELQAEARKYIINRRRTRPRDIIKSANDQIEMHTSSLREWVTAANEDRRDNPWRLASALNLQLLDAARIELGRALDHIRKNRKA